MQDRPSNVVSLNENLTTSSEALRERLLWTDNQGRGWKAREITSSDSRFLQSLEGGLQARNQPADRNTVIVALARLANAIGPDRSKDSWQMLFDDYATDLDGISEPHLQEILTAHRRESNWFPKPAELISRWNALRYAETEQWRRARVLLGLEAAKPWERAQ